MVFAPYNGDWIYDECARVASDAWVAAGDTGPTQNEITIEIWDGLSLAAEAAIPADRPVTVMVLNHGAIPHRFELPELGVSVPLAAGQEATFQIVTLVNGHPYTVDNVAKENVWAVGGYRWARTAGTCTSSP